MRRPLVRSVLFLCLLLGYSRCLGQQQLWLVSTRCLPCYSETGSPEYWQWSGSDWIDADEAALLASDNPAVSTTICIHGNRDSAQDAVDHGWQVAQQFQAVAARPHRLVIWSWPADRIRGIRADLQAKAARTDVESFYLARLLNRMNPQVPLTLMGYSYGARVALGALHLAAGGTFCGEGIAQAPLANRRPLRAILLASAEDADWLAPGHCHELATRQVEQALVTLNCCDPVLKRYPLLYHRGGPPALGFVGPQGVAQPDKLEIIDVTCEVGKDHSWDGYFAAPDLLARLAWYARLQHVDARTAGVP